MAHVVDKMPSVEISNRHKYPWDDWLDGRVWCLRYKKDFFMKKANFKISAFKNARSAGKRLDWVYRGDNVYFQAHRVRAVKTAKTKEIEHSPDKFVVVNNGDKTYERSVPHFKPETLKKFALHAEWMRCMKKLDAKKKREIADLRKHHGLVASLQKARKYANG